MCKKCHTYSVLVDESCPTCSHVYTDFESLAKSIFKNSVFTEAILIMIFVSLGIILAPTITSLYYSLFSGLTFCLIYVIFALIFKNSEYFTALKRLLENDFSKIKAGIEFDSVRAEKDVQDNQHGDAYEKLRDIGDFFDQDEIKIRGVKALNEIVLRKDMELELESFVPISYDKDFATYVINVLKINTTLVTKKVIAYFINYRREIIRDFGRDVLILMAGSSLRMKLYIVEFSGFIEEFLNDFPKERMLRLCSILQANPEENWGRLAEQTKQAVQRKYTYDPDFKAFL